MNYSTQFILFVLALSMGLLSCQPTAQTTQTETKTYAFQSALTFCSTFDQGVNADYSKGDATLYTAPGYEKLDSANVGLSSPLVLIAQGEGLNGGNALNFTDKGAHVIFYKSENNISYSDSNWNGTISLWLKLDPDNDLKPGYTDPIQITDQGYDDAAFWVDFSNKNPRSFRMGVYGDVVVWNPENIGPDENPAFQNRLLPATDLPFSRESWTHVAVSFQGINSDNASASFYINGKHQGDRDISEPFTWELSKSVIFLGLSYVGMLDEVALFDQALSAADIQSLYGLPGGIADLLGAGD